METYCIVGRGLLNPLFYEDPAFFSFFFSMKISDSSFSEQPSILPARFLLEKSEPCFWGKFQKLNLPFVKLGSNYVLKVFMWGTHLDMSFFSTIPVYLRNLTSSGHNFWCTCVKWWYLQILFSFYLILIFWTVRRENG